MPKFQHLRSVVLRPRAIETSNQSYLLMEFGEFGEFPGQHLVILAVDKSVDNVDNWEFGEFGSLTRGLTDMTTMPLYSLRGNLLLVLW